MYRRARAPLVSRPRLPNRPLCRVHGTNGQLLDAAEAAGFEVLVTAGQGIPEQQNMVGRRISVLILRAPTNRLRDLEAIVPAALSSLQAIQPGAIVRTP